MLVLAGAQAVAHRDGVVHPSWSIIQGSYTPGVITAPILFLLALYLATLQRSSDATR